MKDATLRFGALGLLSLIWGGSFFFIKILLEAMGPLSVAFFRTAFGLAAVAALVAVLRTPIRWRAISWPTAAVVALLNTAVPWALIAYGETRLTSNLTSVLNASTPIWTALVGLLAFRQTLAGLQWLGIVVGFAGLVTVVGLEPGQAGRHWTAYASVLLATWGYALSSQLAKHRLTNLSLYETTVATLVVGTLGSLVPALAFEAATWANLARADLLLTLVGLGCLGSGVAYLLFYYLIRVGGAEFATLVTYLVPVTAMLWGTLFLGEPLTPNLFLGLILILTGVFLAGRKPGTIE
ncbi:DMT family transporter [Calditerricola yamamurae]